MPTWTPTQLTNGTAAGRCHSHSYYDIPVIDEEATNVLVHEIAFAERHPTASDVVEVGTVALDRPGEVVPIGESRAWSWQQGPMAQWVGGGGLAAYNDREGDGFVARLVDTRTGDRRALPRPLYAVAPDGRFGLCLNMARLDHLRPGYGYTEGEGALMEERAPHGDGVWRMDMGTGEARMILSLAEAREFLMTRLALPRRALQALRPPHFWFNHVKLSPNAERYTVKLRWRLPNKGWSDKQGVSLTGSVAGGGLRLLADATSHVVWLNDEQLYLWRAPEVALYEDAGGKDNRLRQVAPDLLDHNVHMRHLPPGPTGTLGEAVYDTPYREEIDLYCYDDRTGARELMASFTGHRPARGPFRCDLHPVPSADGRTVIVTSMRDGGRQVYALRR